MIQHGDLSFEQAHDVYSAFYAASNAKGRSQAQVFGELSLDDRKVVVRSIEVMEQYKSRLKQHASDGRAYLAENDPLMPLVERLRGGNNTFFTNQVLVDDLNKSKPIAIQGRAEIVMANNFIAKGKFLGDMDPPDGKLYQKLVGLTDDSYADTKKNVINAIQSWIDELDPGEGKEAAKAGFKKLTEDIKKYTKEQGFNTGNLERICAKFKTEVYLALVEAWAETPLTPADLQAMEIGALGLKPLFLTGITIKEKRAEFEEITSLVKEARKKATENPTQGNIDSYRQVCEEAVAKYNKLEQELLPFGRYPEFAGLYSLVVGEHVDLILLLESTEQNQQKIVELTEIRYIYAMYAAAQGNGEGMYALAEGLLNFGNWSANARKRTGREALEFADLAFNAAKKSGDADLSRKARILKAEILAKNYLVQVELRHEPKGSLEKVAADVVQAYMSLGVDGVPGLYRLFEEAGVSADPMIEILSQRLDSKSVKPTDEEIKMITTAVLAGNEKAKDLLDKLVKLHPVLSKRVPTLNPAHLLANQGAYTSTNAPFSLEDAFLCYEGAFVHLKMELQELSHDRKLDQAAFDRIQPKLIALQENYEKFLDSLGDQDAEDDLVEAQGRLQQAISGLVKRYSSLKFATTEVEPEVTFHSPSLLARFSSAFKRFPESVRKEISDFFNTRIMPFFGGIFSRKPKASTSLSQGNIKTSSIMSETLLQSAKELNSEGADLRARAQVISMNIQQVKLPSLSQQDRQRAEAQLSEIEQQLTSSPYNDQFGEVNWHGMLSLQRIIWQFEPFLVAIQDPAVVIVLLERAKSGDGKTIADDGRKLTLSGALLYGLKDNSLSYLYCACPHWTAVHYQDQSGQPNPDAEVKINPETLLEFRKGLAVLDQVFTEVEKKNSLSLDQVSLEARGIVQNASVDTLLKMADHFLSSKEIASEFVKIPSRSAGKVWVMAKEAGELVGKALVYYPEDKVKALQSANAAHGLDPRHLGAVLYWMKDGSVIEDMEENVREAAQSQLNVIKDLIEAAKAGTLDPTRQALLEVFLRQLLEFMINNPGLVGKKSDTMLSELKELAPPSIPDDDSSSSIGTIGLFASPTELLGDDFNQFWRGLSFNNKAFIRNMLRTVIDPNKLTRSLEEMLHLPGVNPHAMTPFLQRLAALDNEEAREAAIAVMAHTIATPEMGGVPQPVVEKNVQGLRKLVDNIET